MSTFIGDGDPETLDSGKHVNEGECYWCNRHAFQIRYFNAGDSDKVIIVGVCSRECGKKFEDNRRLLLMLKGSVEQRVQRIKEMLNEK